jgi:hypothetical protein
MKLDHIGKWHCHLEIMVVKPLLSITVKRFCCCSLAGESVNIPIAVE